MRLLPWGTASIAAQAAAIAEAGQAASIGALALPVRDERHLPDRRLLRQVKLEVANRRALDEISWVVGRGPARGRPGHLARLVDEALEAVPTIPRGRAADARGEPKEQITRRADEQAVEHDDEKVVIRNDQLPDAHVARP